MHDTLIEHPTASTLNQRTLRHSWYDERKLRGSSGSGCQLWRSCGFHGDGDRLLAPFQCLLTLPLSCGMGEDRIKSNLYGFALFIDTYLIHFYLTACCVCGV